MPRPNLPTDTSANTPASLSAVSRALRAHPTADERPPGVARVRYRYPLRFFVEMGPHLLTGKPRSFRDDCALAVRSLPKRPLLDGLENVPPTGSFVVVVNHYQRRDLWIGWPGGLLSDALWSVRPDLAAVHWVITDRAIVNGASVTWTRPLFLRVAKVWGFIPVTPPEATDAHADRSRLHALRACLRALQRPDGQHVALMICPEGEGGSTRGLMPATPGSGRSLLALTATGVPLLPAAVYEEPNGALHARIGTPWRPTPPTDLPRVDLDAWAGNDAISRIAALLPEPLRGAYRVTPDPAT